MCDIFNRFSRRNDETEFAATRDRPFKRVALHQRGALPLSSAASASPAWRQQNRINRHVMVNDPGSGSTGVELDPIADHALSVHCPPPRECSSI